MIKNCLYIKILNYKIMRESLKLFKNTYPYIFKKKLSFFMHKMKFSSAKMS